MCQSRWRAESLDPIEPLQPERGSDSAERKGTRLKSSQWSQRCKQILNGEHEANWMDGRRRAFMAALLLTALLAGYREADCGSFLFQPSYDRRQCPLPLRPYEAQAGDVMLATDDGLFWQVAHNLAGTGHPHHSGVVFARSDGSMAILEAGPYGTLRVRALDMIPHLKRYEKAGVWIRQRKVPLTPEQSACLTAFAEAQDGKRFALVRLGGQITPFRSRGPLRTWVMGGPHGERRSYFCSELATETLLAAGLLDPATARPSATYPRDLFLDRSPNLFLNRNFKLCDCWHPPARWTSCAHESECATSTRE
jgi:hypothetical protein